MLQNCIGQDEQDHQDQQDEKQLIGRNGTQENAFPILLILFTLSIAFLLLGVPVAGAQESNPSDSSSVVHANEASAQWLVGPFIGYAHNSPVSQLLGITPGRDHLFLGLQATTEILRLGPLRASYAVQLLPLVVISGRSAPLDYDGEESGRGLLPGPDRAYAVGASPFGFEIATATDRRVAVYGATAAGGLIFTRPFPVPEARQFNFTLEYGGGVMVRITQQRWLKLGYKYHHLSNAYTAKVNPGLDGNVFYAGYQWGVKLPR